MFIERLMRHKLSWNRDAWPPLWRVSISLLLIALVLYNPFSALHASSGRLSYDKLARHRASIGSGELQHFSPVSNPLGQADIAIDVDVNGAEPAACIQKYQTGRDEHELLASEPELLAGVWFRPPPSL